MCQRTPLKFQHRRAFAPREREESGKMAYLTIGNWLWIVRWIVRSVVLALALGALLMIWPGIFALFFGLLLLLQSCTAEQENTVWAWAEARLCSYRLTSSSGLVGVVPSAMAGGVLTTQIVSLSRVFT